MRGLRSLIFARDSLKNRLQNYLRLSSGVLFGVLDTAISSMSVTKLCSDSVRWTAFYAIGISPKSPDRKSA